MNNIQIHSSRKTQGPARDSKISINDILKKYQEKKIHLEKVVEFADDIEKIGLTEEEILQSKDVFNSSFCNENYHLISMIMEIKDKENKTKGFYIGIRNKKEGKQILRLVPQNPKFAYCEAGSKTKLWMNIDRSKTRDMGDGVTFWENYIRNSRPDSRIVYMNKLTTECRVDAFATSTLKQMAQPAYATRLEKCDDFADYMKKHDLKEKDYISFVL